MSRNRRRTPRLEPLEGKQLLSTAHAHVTVHKPPAVHPASPPLIGALVASTHTTVQDAVLAQTVTMPFSGSAGAMGRVRAVLTEDIDQSAEAVAKGNLVLTNGSGTITLSFGRVNVLQNLTMPYNSQFLANYTVTAATGAYAGKAGGTGVLQVTEDVASPVFRLKIDPTT
jgi:hypothetical protein